MTPISPRRTPSAAKMAPPPSARIKAIVAAPEAKGREQLAHTIAFETELAPEQAISMLKALPEAQKVSRLNGHVPAPRIDAVDPTSGASVASAGLAAATQRLKTYGKAAV
jgi:capsid assembly protease